MVIKHNLTSGEKRRLARNRRIVRRRREGLDGAELAARVSLFGRRNRAREIVLARYAASR